MTMPKRTAKDLPREELANAATLALLMYPGAAVFFKYTCEKCGHRCQFAEPNKLYEKGICDVCGHETPVSEGGFALVFTLGPKNVDVN